MSDIDTIVVGGSQAGLATSYHLQRLGVDHAVLDENDEVGASWRKRWESLRLFTPGKYNTLPGMPYPGEPWSYPGKDDIANYLQAYSREFKLPVRTGVKVHAIRSNGDRYLLESSDGPIRANNVVVATGAFHNPRIPAFASSLDPKITQFHSADYGEVSHVPEGPALVVGAGQSGAEIALDLVGNHQVWLSGKDNGEEPFSPGSLPERIFKRIGRFVVTKVVNVANPIGRKARDHFLYPPRGIPRAGGTKKKILETGIEWVDRTTGTKDGKPQLEDGRVLDVTSIVWCTGFAVDYSWIHLPIFGDYGYPIHNRGVVESQPGLYFMGLLFQSALASALIVGVGKDAKYVAEHIAARRDATTRMLQ